MNDLVVKMELNNKYQEVTHNFIANFSRQQSISISIVRFSFLFSALLRLKTCDSFHSLSVTDGNFCHCAVNVSDEVKMSLPPLCI